MSAGLSKALTAPCRAPGTPTLPRVRGPCPRRRVMFFSRTLSGRPPGARCGNDMASLGGNSTTAPPVHPVPERTPAARAEADARRSALVLSGLFVAASTLFLLLPDALQARSNAAPSLLLLRDGL